MAESDSGGGGSSPLNLNTVLVLLLLAGSVWLVSPKLTSDRPVTPAGGPRDFVGEQKLEARLWEDPFKSPDTEGKRDADDQVETKLNSFLEQIRWRSEAPDSVLLLPVMLSGGQYSENQENRIRSRFAIVSALGQSGYAPEDAEHIGVLTIPWPSQHEVTKAKQRTDAGLKKLWDKNGPLGFKTTSRLELRYEWYKPRSFFPRPGNDGLRTNVLVLWLDDSFFEDEPLLRLPLLLEPLTDPARLHSGNIPTVSLIGPRHSSTLRAMLPGQLAGTKPLWEVNPGFWHLATNLLRNITVYCGTASAMDEVLATNQLELPMTNRDVTTRKAVGVELVKNGFNAFHNFAATDAQLAREVFAELALNHIELTNTNEHLVLISEWDTFYARVLSLTYGAELAVRQNCASNDADFVYSYISGTNGAKQMPTNLHSFVYLRGLDGQTVKGETGGDGGGDERAAKPSLTSVEELRNWTPNANRAEGQAQFDYLSRLGGQLADLEAALHRRQRGHIKAIGIVGSDVYDTLLILQALRPQFPDVTFFTTDFDARFVSPHEREWTRDLLVVSGYGLALHPGLQKEVAPFRDSSQTAQFAAALAALGNTNLLALSYVPPRRFEIGSHAVLDLSVTNLRFADTHLRLHPLTASEIYSAHSRQVRSHSVRRLVLGFVILLTLTLACWFWGPLRRLTLEGFQYPCKALDYSAEDIGGPDGAETLLRPLRASGDEIITWLKQQLPSKFHTAHSPARRNSKDESKRAGRSSTSAVDTYFEHLLEKERKTQEDADEAEAGSKHEEHLYAQAGALLAVLNGTLKSETRPPKIETAATAMMPWFDLDWERIRPWILPAPCWRAMRPMKDCYRIRRMLDACLHKLAEVELAGNDLKEYERDTLRSAAAARESAQEIFRLRCKRLICLWAGGFAFAVAALVLGIAIWNDTFRRPEGEPFSLTSGASAWPAEILRLVVCAAAVGFSFELYSRMRETFFALTRKFRLSFPTRENSAPPAMEDRPAQIVTRKTAAAEKPEPRKIPGRLVSSLKALLGELLFFQPAQTPESANHVCALKIWQDYREKGQWSFRIKRVALPLLVYLVLGVAAFCLLEQSPFDTVRGSTARHFNRWLVCGSGFTFSLLAFLTVDAVLLCRRFILALSQASTDYPEATRRHFSREHGNIGAEYLEDWIDLQLIAELTERVSQMVYYPAILLFVLLLARNSWWNSWSWSKPLIFVFAFNLLLALASVLILQRNAGDAKREAERNMTVKVNALQARNAPTSEENNATQAEKLLEEIHDLSRGAFVPFWKNPVVGALFLSSGGTTALQVLIWFLGR